MTRFGAVLVFKEGVTREQVAAALETIRPLLEVPEIFVPQTSVRLTPTEKTQWRETHPDWGCAPSNKLVLGTPRPYRMDDAIGAFNPDHGFPVWYIP